MESKKSYETVIKLINTGEDNAISLNELSRLCGLNPRMIKQEVQNARMDGVIICSTDKGYFYPRTLADTAGFYRRFHKKAMTTLTVIKHARNELISCGIDPNELAGG